MVANTIAQYAYHVTPFESNESQPTINSLIRSSPIPNHRPSKDMPSVFLSTTLHEGKLPDYSIYPVTGEEGSSYYRVKIPLNRFKDCDFWFCGQSGNQVFLLATKRYTGPEAFHFITKEGDKLTKIDIAHNTFLRYDRSKNVWYANDSAREFLVVTLAVWQDINIEGCEWDTVEKKCNAEPQPYTDTPVRLTHAARRLKNAYRMLTNFCAPIDDAGKLTIRASSQLNTSNYIVKCSSNLMKKTMQSLREIYNCSSTIAETLREAGNYQQPEVENSVDVVLPALEKASGLFTKADGPILEACLLLNRAQDIMSNMDHTLDNIICLVTRVNVCLNLTLKHQDEIQLSAVKTAKLAENTSLFMEKITLFMRSAEVHIDLGILLSSQISISDSILKALEEVKRLHKHSSKDETSKQKIENLISTAEKCCEQHKTVYELSSSIRNLGMSAKRKGRSIVDKAVANVDDVAKLVILVVPQRKIPRQFHENVSKLNKCARAYMDDSDGAKRIKLRPEENE